MGRWSRKGRATRGRLGVRRRGCPPRGGVGWVGGKRAGTVRPLTAPGKLQPRAAFPDAPRGGSGLAPVRLQLLDLGLGDRVLRAPVEAAHGAAVLVEGELQRRVALLRVQAGVAAHGHPAAGLRPARHPQHRRREQLCGEGFRRLRVHGGPAQGSQGTRARVSTAPRPLCPSGFP